MRRQNFESLENGHFKDQDQGNVADIDKTSKNQIYLFGNISFCVLRKVKFINRFR